MTKKCTPLWREAHLEVNRVKNWRSRTTFGSWDVEKVHTVVARSTFPSQNVKSTTCSDHLWTFKYRFAWQAQGTVPLSKVRKRVRVLWQFELSTTTTTALHCTPLHSATTTTKITITTTTTTTLHYTTQTTTTTTTTTRYTTLYYATQLHYTTQRQTTPHHTTLDYTTLDYATLLYIRLHSLHHRNCNCNRNYTTPQLQLHYVTNYNYSCATPHYIQQLWVRWPTRWPLQPLYSNHSKKHNSNHLAVHQWIRFAIRDSQQPSSPIGFLVWNFCHRLVRQYWYLVFFKK